MRIAVQYDMEVVEKSLLSTLRLLMEQVERGSFREATGEPWLRQLREGVDQVKERLHRPFCLLVVGDFKRGKSTLINALVGQELVTMDVAPETVVITELHAGPELKIEIRMVDGGKVRLTSEDLPNARLSRIVEQLPAPADILKIEAPLPFLEGVMVVDSPGTGDLLWRFDRRVQEYLPRADAILHVVSSLSPLSDTERAFLRLSLRPLELPKLSFVVNQMDLMPSEGDAQRVLERVRSSLQASFPDSAVLGISALQELSRITGEPSPKPDRAFQLDADFAALRHHLATAVLFHRDVVRGERAAYEAVSLLRRSEDQLLRMQRLLETDRSRLRDALQEARNQNSSANQAILRERAALRTLILEKGEEACGWMDGLLHRLETETHFEGLNQEQLQKNVPFFFSQVVRDGIAACLDAHQDPILSKVEACSLQAAAALGELNPGHRLSEAADNATFHTPAWTFFDHMLLVGTLLGAVTGLVAPLLVGLMDRGLAQEKRAAHYRQSLSAAFPELRRQVAKGVREAYGSLADRVEQQLTETQVSEQRKLEEDFSGAIALHDRGLDRVRETGKILGEVAALVQENRLKVEALRSRFGEVQHAH